MRNLFRHTAASIVTIFALLLYAVVAAAAPPSFQINLPEQDLSSALAQLARQCNIELLFDQTLVAGKRTPAFHGRESVERALTQLLSRTGLTYRRSPEGAYVVMPAVMKANAPRQDPAASPTPSAAVAEILVVGRRTQNADIRRSVDDIQPYQVLGSDTINAAQPQTLEDFLRTRVSSNTQALTESQQPISNNGATRSQINLRGLGVDQTLVLVDGRRLPSIPGVPGFQQPDINGLAVGAVDRVEILGASAGGIFGPGAAGGVVNIILKREFEGVELAATSGASTRGDGRLWSAGGRFGATSTDGRTHFMVRFGYSEDDGLTVGDRDFVVEARKLRTTQITDPRESVASNSINFNSVLGTPLTLTPSLGGGSLNAATTFLPLNAPALLGGGLAILKANAGGYDLALSPDGQGAEQSLVTPTRTGTVAATLRHEFTPRVEGYLDVLWMADDGDATIPAVDTTTRILEGGQIGNPFNQEVDVSFPTPGLLGHAKTDTTTDRLSVGLIVRLGDGWALNLDAALGKATVRNELDQIPISPLQVDPTLGAAALAAQLAKYSVSTTATAQYSNVMEDLNLRLAGPVLQAPAGPLTLTLAGEARRERNPVGQGQDFDVSSGALGMASASPPYEEWIDSAFLEARAPLVAKDSALVPLRGLSLQLALRGDYYAQTIPTLTAISPGPLLGSQGVNQAVIAAATIGASMTPVDGLLLRASFATGATPPTSAQLISGMLLVPFAAGLVDPKRGGLQSGVSGAFNGTFGGSPNSRPQQTQTMTAGMVIQPPTAPGLRLSIDYTRLNTDDEITDFATNDDQYFIDHESIYPGRVTRAPLTAADAALGFTGGKILAVDASSLQVGRSILQAVDFALDYRRLTDLGAFQVYALATWEPDFRRWGEPDMPSFQLAGHPDGALVWRSNGGVGWSSAGWSSGFDVQLYSAYSGAPGAPPTYFQLTVLGLKGALPSGFAVARAPMEAYVDWTLAYRTSWSGRRAGIRGLEYRLSVKDIFDAQPPIVASTLATGLRDVGNNTYDFNPEGGYSPYGDARGRRFDASIIARF
ncbi:MAG: TonB-dependent receptor [Caulobacteraceae bacterium]